MDLSKAGKLCVGDIAKYEQWKKDETKKELIATMRAIYPDGLPDDAFSQIENQLKSLPSLMDDGDLDLAGIQYLLWMAVKKNDPDVTFDQVGESLNLENADKYIEQLFPPSVAEKKRKKRGRVTEKKVKKSR